MNDFNGDGTLKKGGDAEKAIKTRILRACAALLQRGEDVPKSFDFDMEKVSFIGVGGIAPAAFFPNTLAGFTELLRELRRQSVPFCLFGTVANVLIPDGKRKKDDEKGVLNGAAVFTKNLRSIAVDGENIFAFCGVTGAELLSAAAEAGLGGAEFLSGVPCSVGGATYMNAGSNGRHVSDAAESVLAYGDGEMRVYTNAECRFSYKQSAFMGSGEAILGVTFRFKRVGNAGAAALQRDAERKRAGLPKGKSLGCIFKNPPPLIAGERRISAGALIESSGMKGAREGGAVVSKDHANFIINEDGATYEDVRALIERVRRAVFETHGVRLEEEIRYLGGEWRDERKRR